ncbi:MAG: lysozyme inhibitor LprI family protein [Pseudomonadota bacterium]
MNRHFFLALALVAPVAFGANDCANAPSHSEQRACLEQLAATTAAEVALVQCNATNRITHLDEETTVKDNILKHFRAATKQFRRYRRTQCEFEATAAAGGNGAGDLRLQCEVRLNREYIARLKVPLGLL